MPAQTGAASLSSETSSVVDDITSLGTLVLEVQESLGRFRGVVKKLDAVARTNLLPWVDGANHDYTRWLGASSQSAGKLGLVVRSFVEETIPLSRDAEATLEERLRFVERTADQIEQVLVDIAHNSSGALAQVAAPLASMRDQISAFESQSAHDSTWQIEHMQDEIARHKQNPLFSPPPSFLVEMEAKLADLKSQAEKTKALFKQAAEESAGLVGKLRSVEEKSKVFFEICKKLHVDCRNLGDCLRYTESTGKFQVDFSPVAGKVREALDAYCIGIQNRLATA